MRSLIARRFGIGLLLLLIVSSVVFLALYLVPGDAAASLLGDDASPARLAEIRDRLGLDEPFLVQYWNWLSGALTGDFGQSLVTSQGVSEAISERLPVTLSLTFGALFVALVTALPAGTLAALRRGGATDRAVTLMASVGIALPNFWIGLLLLMVFALNNRWLPAVGYVPLTEDPWQWARHIVLPAIALGLAAAAEIARQLRASLCNVLEQDYIRTARAMGLRSRSVIGRHALKNAALPVVTVVGVRVAALLGGTAVIEQIFGIPGLGQLAVRSTLLRDLPMVQGIVVVSTVIVLTVNFLVDISYAWLNPKVRAG